MGWIDTPAWNKKSPVPLIQITLLNGCEHLLKYCSALVSWVGMGAEDFSKSHSKNEVLRCRTVWGVTDRISPVCQHPATSIEKERNKTERMVKGKQELLIAAQNPINLQSFHAWVATCSVVLFALLLLFLTGGSQQSCDQCLPSFLR